MLKDILPKTALNSCCITQEIVGIRTKYLNRHNVKNSGVAEPAGTGEPLSARCAGAALRPIVWEQTQETVKSKVRLLDISRYGQVGRRCHYCYCTLESSTEAVNTNINNVKHPQRAYKKQCGLTEFVIKEEEVVY